MQIDLPQTNNNALIIMKTRFSLLLLIGLVGCVDPSAGRPTGTTQPAPANQTANAAASIVGIWSFPQVAPDVSPVAITLNANSTYALETEGNVFEQGKWSISGNQIRLVSASGKPITTTFQVLSKSKLRWGSKDVLDRLR